MIRFGSIHSSIALSVLAGFSLLGLPGNAASETPTEMVDHAATEGRIDCITPDGRTSVLRAPDEADSTAPAVADGNTIRCPLQAGETIFIISLPEKTPFDHFTFVNETGGVQGDLRIAVSNNQLPANSPKWTEVNGKTEFVSKRLFNLSLVGVEACYVKLSFHVEKGNQIASANRFDGISP